MDKEEYDTYREAYLKNIRKGVVEGTGRVFYSVDLINKDGIKIGEGDLDYYITLMKEAAGIGNE